MEAIELKFGDAVRAFWYDSCHQPGWVYGDFEGTVGKVVSLGFVVEAKANAKTLTLSTSLGCDHQILSPVSIPWAAIQKLERLESKWDRAHVLGPEDEEELQPDEEELVCV
jgi:hypothetical protein